MVERIAKYDQVGEIIIVDNGSDYEPLLEWYTEQSIAKIVYCDNLGHAGAWISGVVSEIKEEFYVVSDGDLGIDDTPDNTLVILKEKLFKQPNLQKIGVGLNWNIVSPKSPYYNRLNLYEKDRWSNSRIIDDVYVDVHIDTTFAMYNVNNYFIGGGSLYYPYVARHYPWELSINHDNAEFSYYLKSASSSSSYKMIVPTT
jgi:glycosyltransferase involved in cell wall biosynthesis